MFMAPPNPKQCHLPPVPLTDFSLLFHLFHHWTEATAKKARSHTLPSGAAGSPKTTQTRGVLTVSCYSHLVITHFTPALAPLTQSHPAFQLHLELPGIFFSMPSAKHAACAPTCRCRHPLNKYRMQFPGYPVEMGMHRDKRLSCVTDMLRSKWFFMRVKLFGNMSLNRLQFMLSICKVSRKSAP